VPGAVPTKQFEIAGRSIGDGQPCFVVAEAGVNHNGDPRMAARLVDAAADAGADAVKFQAFRAGEVASVGSPKAAYQLRSGTTDESQADMLSRLELSPETFADLARRAKSRGTLFLASAFDVRSVDMLVGLGVPALKLGSGEITNLALLEHAAQAGVPLILSTGMADLPEIAQAVDTVGGSGDAPLVLLHCTSAYPAPAEQANLRAIATMRDEFGLPVGYSDHSEGDAVALAAVALGACVLEKHFTLDRSLPGPDHRASLEPAQLAELVRRIRLVEGALGDGVKRPTPTELENAAVVRRSLAAAEDIPAGTVLSDGMVTALRPGTGIPPGKIGEVLGRRVRRALSKGELLSSADLE
jgi:N,N'-diacetyllegionaminate synthase